MTELIISTVVGMGLLMAISQILISKTRTTTTSMSNLQRRVAWNKLTDLLAAESSEGNQLSTAAVMTGPCVTNGVTRSLFTISVPVLNATGTTLTNRNIHYYQVGTGTGSVIRRCGPDVGTSGALNADPTSASIDAVVITGIPISVTSPSSCTRCLRINSNFANASENDQLIPMLLRAGFQQISS